MTVVPRGRRAGGHCPPAVDPVRQHRDWLALVEVTGPFLSLPVLRETWPTLEPIDSVERDTLRRAHGAWRDDVTTGHHQGADLSVVQVLQWRAIVVDERLNVSISPWKESNIY